MQQLLDQHGIQRRLSIPGNLQQTARAERINRTLLNKARCLIQEANLDKSFWAEAIATATYINNRTPKRVLNDKIPEEMWTSKEQDLSRLTIFSCKALSHVPETKIGKMDIAYGT